MTGAVDLDGQPRVVGGRVDMGAYELTSSGLIITTTALPDGIDGEPYLAALTATGGTPPYMWSILAGSLPLGVALTPAGALTGIPARVGTYPFTASVHDALSSTTAKELSCNISVRYGTKTNLLAWYSFDDANNLGKDESGNAHDGANYGAVGAAGGALNGCVYFDGYGQYISVPHHADFNVTNLTVGFWIKTPTDASPSGQSRILGKWDERWRGWFGHMLPNGGVFAAMAYGNAAHEHVLNVEHVGRTQWTHITFVMTPLSCTLYTNGLACAQTNLSVEALLPTSQPLCMGGFPSWGWAWMKGWLDEVKLWGRTLTPDEIAREAHRPQPPFVTVAPTQQVVCAGQVATLAIAYGDNDGTAELTINGAPAAAVVNSNKTSLTWTPGASDVGRHVIEFVATDNDLLTASATAVIIVTQRTDRLEIVTAALPDGTVNVPYDAVLQAAGGVRPYAWTISGGALPDGITLATNGTLAGQTAVAGRYAFMVRVTDGNSQFVERLFALSVADGTPATVRILTAALPDALVGEAYAVMLKASGGMAPYAWEIVDGFLPDGMSLNPSNGVVRGTALVATNAFFIVMVTDHNGNCDSKPLVIRVRPEDDYSLAINEISLAKFMINWRKHVLGPDDDVDHVWVRLTFAVPDGLTLEEHVPLTLFFGAYPIDGLNAEITPNGRRATYFEGDARNGDLPVVKMIVQLRQNGGQPLGIVYAVVRYADLDGELGALNETIVNGRLTVPVQLLIGAYEGCGSIEMRYDAKKNRKGKGKYPIR